ncbi:MAG: tetratricopeptide repeat protein [Gammaproteobacteria bacterium]|nr:tetratricopeptide repeat protein [Gammaproteobacteria bacterium]MDH5777654.1 tetratricopeptide repeat protein [Gammaproteobacteria bacterium]
MLKPFINNTGLALFLSVTLAACGGAPTINTPDIPANAEREYAKALASMKAKKTTTALAQFKQLIKKYPKLAGAHANIGMIYIKLNKFDQAESSLTKSIELNPANPMTHNYLGIAYRHLGRFEDSKKAYQAALKIDDDYAFAHLNIGILYDLYLFDMQMALKHYQRYQDITDDSDKMVEKWIVDLKRRDTAENKPKGEKG